MLIAITIVGCVLYGAAGSTILLAWHKTAGRPVARVICLVLAVAFAVGVVFAWKAVVEAVVPASTSDDDEDLDWSREMTWLWQRTPAPVVFLHYSQVKCQPTVPHAGQSGPRALREGNDEDCRDSCGHRRAAERRCVRRSGQGQGQSPAAGFSADCDERLKS